MFAVGKLGSYIRYRVSSPIPLGGAVDIIVVEQQDGTFKSTPWYVRFGKFQGNITERLVTINVNGVDADFHMYLDHKGEAFFIREVDGIEGELETYPSFGDEMDVKSDSWKTQKSMSCNYDANRTSMVDEFDGSPRKGLSRSNSRRGKIFGLPIGRRSMKENGVQDGNAVDEVDRVTSLKRAEIAADLLEVRWSTNLRTGQSQKARTYNGSITKQTLKSMEFTLDDTYMETHCNNTENSVGDVSSNPSQIAGTDEATSNDRNETRDEVSMSPRCRTGGGFPLDIGGAKEVEEAPLEKFSSTDLSASISGLKSLPVVSKKDRSNRVRAISDDSKEEQFPFSDLDDPQLEKGKHSKSSSLGSSEGLSSSGSSDDGESNTVTRMNPNRMSSPIGISKTHSDADVAALVPAVESLPNMVFDGDNLSVNATQPYGRSLDSTLEAFKMVDDGNSLGGAQQQMVNSLSPTNNSQISEEIRKILSDPAIEVSLCRHALYEGMGYEAAARAFDAQKLDMDKFLSFGRDILEDDRLVVRIGGLYFPWDAALPIASSIGSQEQVQNLEPKGMIAVGENDEGISRGVAARSINSRSESRRMWPFSFRKTNSMRSRSFSSEIQSPRTKEIVADIDKIIPRVLKKKLQAKFPTSEQLGSLNLKEGKNAVTFTFSSAMFGEQQVDARIFLWKWNSRIVISDVDGTITKSDVLGQFMPLMGYDWSQTGVAHLFSAIKENGYQLLFLSARSISQAYLTRQFLINLKQDGKALPEGPVLISPDGLFPSLYREVIRRAPHEFKIACLEDVKVLFPVDHNPFYAGFGNRDTDELSYLKVGIPKGKIFTINPKGEVVVNRRVDSKTYTSLHALVHDMFPPTTNHEPEDYNSWNFWRLPPPDTII